jgi:hypothetical protein
LCFRIAIKVDPADRLVGSLAPAVAERPGGRAGKPFSFFVGRASFWEFMLAMARWGMRFLDENDRPAPCEPSNIVGERWTMLIVRELLIGPTQFKVLIDNFPRIGPNLLTEQTRRSGSTSTRSR